MLKTAARLNDQSKFCVSRWLLRQFLNLKEGELATSER